MKRKSYQTQREGSSRRRLRARIRDPWVDLVRFVTHYLLSLPGSRGKIVIKVEDLDGLLANFSVEKKEP